jgi:hypothetical protein
MVLTINIVGNGLRARLIRRIARKMQGINAVRVAPSAKKDLGKAQSCCERCIPSIGKWYFKSDPEVLKAIR